MSTVERFVKQVKQWNAERMPPEVLHDADTLVKYCAANPLFGAETVSSQTPEIRRARAQAMGDHVVVAWMLGPNK